LSATEAGQGLLIAFLSGLLEREQTINSIYFMTTDTHVIGMTLNQTDVVTVYGSDGNLTFNLFGVETS